jgi:serine/threonine-protein kinase
VPDLSPAPPAFDPGLLVGSVLDGRYELTGHIATGGMGAVFRARHRHLRKDLAVKVLRPELSDAPDLVERFRREAEIASHLEHDNIVRVTDFGRSEDGYLFLVMELLEGESLFDRLRREAPLPPGDAVPILWQICSGLVAAHALGVVHRDLKPENVFLARTSSGREVTKLLDFGIAKSSTPSSGHATQAGTVVGTPEYLSPEQAMGLAVDSRADLYTVGLIAFRALSGRPPFQAEDARELLMKQASWPVPPLTAANPALSAWPGLVTAVARACEKDPAARPQTAAELRDLFAAALGPAFLKPPGATPAPPVDRSSRHAAQPAAPGVHGAAAPASFAGAPAPGSSPDRGRASRSRLAAACRTALRSVRGRPRTSAAIAAALLAAAALALGAAWRRGRPAAEARALLAAGRPAAARTALEAALAGRSGDPELLVLRARALTRLPGSAGEALEALEAFDEARAAGPLDDAALQDLAGALGRERSLADRVARLLRGIGEPAVPALAATARAGSGLQRLRALALLRDLGAEDAVDRAALYGALLAEPDCELRRAAARRLGELGDSAALPALRAAAAARAERRRSPGTASRPPACGAGEAGEAVRRIQAAR